MEDFENHIKISFSEPDIEIRFEQLYLTQSELNSFLEVNFGEKNSLNTIMLVRNILKEKLLNCFHELLPLIKENQTYKLIVNIHANQD
ncbi:MAG: hypothetical protein K8R53_03470, partial [Bacteroidales bacterium]|nr:hypothetical protein [Bacteroidales bacterium]